MGTEKARHNTSSTLVLRQDLQLLGPYVAPHTATERKLAEIFCWALSMDQVSVTDDFEELGGDSLIAATISLEIGAIRGQSVDDFREGWHYPGELAAFDDCGYIRDRTSEVVFRAGLKIIPTEIEAVLQAHGKVADAAVVAHATGNEADLGAYVVTKEEITPGQLLAQLSPAAYESTEQIHIVPELPRNASGTVDKRALANRYEGVTP